VLNKRQILERLLLPSNAEDSLVVTPLLGGPAGSEAVGDDAIDLRLGGDFLIARSDRLLANVPGLAHGSRFHAAVHVPMGEFLVLPGHHTVLASTLEYMKLPASLAAMVLTKSSWARNFLTIETAPWVHPEYRGCLTLEIANVTETPQVLYPGYHIAQLVLLHVTRDPRESNVATKAVTAPRPKSYYGPVKPEPPKLPSPTKYLSKELGLPRDLIANPEELLK
jgi:dCTP deaminase